AQLRVGVAFDGRDTIHFAARAFLDHDTLAQVPRDLRDVAAGRGEPPVELRDAAIARNRDVLRHAAESWVAKSPANPAAYEALARYTEVSGGVAIIGNTRVSALDAIQQARARTSDASQQIRLAAIETRLHLKMGDFAA